MVCVRSLLILRDMPFFKAIMSIRSKMLGLIIYELQLYLNIYDGDADDKGIVVILPCLFLAEIIRESRSNSFMLICFWCCIALSGL